MKIDLASLRPIAIGDRQRFDECCAKMASQSSECSFVNLFVYRDSYGFEFADFGDRLVVYERKARVIHYPIGAWTTPAQLRKISLAFMEAGLTDGGIYDVPEEYLDKHADCDNGFEIDYDEGAIDYLFSVEKIATCSGPKLRKKYNLIKQFQANWPAAEIRRLTDDELPAAERLANDLNSREIQCEYIDEQTRAMNQAWLNFENLGLDGIILYAEPGYPAGFSVFSILPSDTADIHFEMADHSVKGASQTLTRFLALELRSRAKFMNREQDYNEPNLRHAKRSLDPERFFKRYFLRTIK